MFPYEHISHAVSDNLHNGKRSDPGPACVVSTCILPDGLWELLPNLQSLSLSFVWIARNECDTTREANQAAQAQPSLGGHLESCGCYIRRDAFPSPTSKYTLPSSEQWYKHTVRLASVPSTHKYSIACTDIATSGLGAVLIHDELMRPCYLDMLARTMARDALTSVVLFEDLTAQGCDIHDLGLFLAPAQSTLTHLHVHALPELEETMWSAIDLHSFIKLREVTVRYILLCPLDLNGKAHWAQLTSFLHHLPIGSIERLTINVSVTLTPECYLNNSIEPGFERVPEEVKSSFDPAFKRLLPTLKLCEFIWRPDACFDIDTSIYFNQWQMLIPSLTEAGIVHLKHEPFNPYK
ncbi:hypothetical protein K474DRAFT_1679312 [Panus rudis PR-1116 ss-1]|nr:hypothetical protein K474DRAFT_1679312 [Panus rudis PR-1116 ss-1]